MGELYAILVIFYNNWSAVQHELAPQEEFLWKIQMNAKAAR